MTYSLADRCDYHDPDIQLNQMLYELLFIVGFGVFLYTFLPRQLGAEIDVQIVGDLGDLGE